MSHLARLLPFAFVVILSACRHSMPEPFPLQWRKASQPGASSTVGDNLRVRIIGLTLQDRRPQINVVGTDEDTGTPFVTTTNVAEFCTREIARMIGSAGATISDQNQDGIVQVELIEYGVIEGGTFQGTVRLRVTLFERTGRRVFSGDFEGKDGRWGRTHNEENVNEALSGALAQAMEHLLKDDAFGKALDQLPRSRG